MGITDSDVAAMLQFSCKPPWFGFCLLTCQVSLAACIQKCIRVENCASVAKCAKGADKSPRYWFRFVVSVGYLISFRSQPVTVRAEVAAAVASLIKDNACLLEIA